jgi:hypothetical protein
MDANLVISIMRRATVLWETPGRHASVSPEFWRTDRAGRMIAPALRAETVINSRPYRL